MDPFDTMPAAISFFGNTEGRRIYSHLSTTIGANRADRTLMAQKMFSTFVSLIGRQSGQDILKCP